MIAICIVDLVSDNQTKRYKQDARMAEAMIEAIRDKSGCLAQDLNANGFTPDEVAEHWHLAKPLAAAALRMNSERTVTLSPLFWRKA